MQKPVFISHKKVTPTAMTLAEYNAIQGWKLPKDQNGAIEGYLIEYLDGGEPNHKDYAGYISWSPKEQFDNGYTEFIETSEPVVGSTVNGCHPHPADIKTNIMNAFTHASQSLDIDKMTAVYDWIQGSNTPTAK